MKKFLAAKKKEVENFLEKYWMYTTPIILLVGFIIHTITFDRVDRLFEHAVLLVHMIIVGVTTALIFSKDTTFGRRHKIYERDSILSALMLFSFGSLFSGFLIFYAKSGSLISSWPFILVMLILMLGPELRKGYYKKPVLQISIYYIAIFSYLIFSIPVIIRRIGPEVYILSGLISLLLISFYLWILARMDKRNLLKYRNKLIIRISSIFIIFNILYFTNVIPPIPLSLTFRAVYHDFSRVQGLQYSGFYEQTPNWLFWKKRSAVFHERAGEPVYVFSSVYAPVNLNTDIYHKWEYFDTKKTRWVETDRIKIPITGGRVDGYRGFSKKTNVFPGSWRVKITTDRNQTIGQIMFKIKEDKGELNLAKDTFN